MMKIVSMHIKEWAEMGKKGSSMYTLLFIYAIILSALNIILPDIKTVWIIIGVLFCFSILVFFYYWKKKITIHARPKVVINIVKEDLLVSKEGYMNILPFNVFFEDSLEEKFVNSNSINGKAIRLFPDLIGVDCQHFSRQILCE